MRVLSTSLCAYDVMLLICLCTSYLGVLCIRLHVIIHLCLLCFISLAICAVCFVFMCLFVQFIYFS